MVLCAIHGQDNDYGHGVVLLGFTTLSALPDTQRQKTITTRTH